MPSLSTMNQRQVRTPVVSVTGFPWLFIYSETVEKRFSEEWLSGENRFLINNFYSQKLFG
jgi:hypothetical protein